jgi:putative ABC transport system permease protein
VSVAVTDEPVVLGTGNGGLAARRAVARWGWRLFRREWRQQLLITALLLIAVAASTGALCIAASRPTPQASTFGSAGRLATLTSTGAQADADIDRFRSAFGTIEVIRHRNIAVPGSANTFDLRAQDPHGAFASSTLRLDDGRYPRGAGELAVTDRVAAAFGLRLGGTWDLGGARRTVVGLVENPLDLRDDFALVAAGPLTPFGPPATSDRVTVLVAGNRADGAPPGGLPDVPIEVRGTGSTDSAPVAVLVLSTIGLLFVGLLAVAGFTVMAHRRMRALGMLGAMGAGQRHIRLVLVSNGAALGILSAVTGVIAGLIAWITTAPRLESLLGYRIDAVAGVPWGLCVVTVALATLTATLAAWWPARSAARVPVVAALSARPAPPRPAHRFAAVGALTLLAGLAALVEAQQTRPPLIVGGVVATAAGLLLLSPLGIATAGRLAPFAPLAPRLALRDLSRYRARSSAALAATGLAVGIAAVVALAAAVAVAKAAAPTGGNLPTDQAVFWLNPGGLDMPLKTSSAAQRAATRQRVDTLATGLDAAPVLALQAAVDTGGLRDGSGRGAPDGHQPLQFGKPHTASDGGRGTEYRSDDSVPVFVATPEVLARYGIDPKTIDPGTDILTSRTDLGAGYDAYPISQADWHPRIQRVELPAYTSLPTTLITTHAIESLHLTQVPIAYLVDAPRPLTQPQIDRLVADANAAGLTVETRPTGADAARIARIAVAAGFAVALGILGATVGLIRSESARDLQTLTAAGARPRTRRALTAATAGVLALLAAVIGTSGAYLALLAWYHRTPHWLGHVPVPELTAILVGLPLAACLGGWILAGKERPGLGRRTAD